MLQARKVEKVQKHSGRELVPGLASSVMYSVIMFWPKVYASCLKI